MGNLDESAKKLIKENAVFADALNVFRYKGRKVIKPEYLSDTDSVHTIAVFHCEQGAESDAGSNRNHPCKAC